MSVNDITYTVIDALKIPTKEVIANLPAPARRALKAVEHPLKALDRATPGFVKVATTLPAMALIPAGAVLPMYGAKVLNAFARVFQPELAQSYVEPKK